MEPSSAVSKAHTHAAAAIVTAAAAATLATTPAAPTMQVETLSSEIESLSLATKPDASVPAVSEGELIRRRVFIGNLDRTVGEQARRSGAVGTAGGEAA